VGLESHMKEIEFLYYLPKQKGYAETIACFFEKVSNNSRKKFVGDRRNMPSKIIDDYWNNTIFSYIKDEEKFDDARYFRKCFLEVL